MILAADANFPDTSIVPSGALGAAVGWVMIAVFWVGAVTIGLILGGRQTPSEGGESRSLIVVTLLIPAAIMIAGLIFFRSVLPFPLAIVIAVGVGVAAFVALRMKFLVRSAAEYDSGTRIPVICAVVGHSPTLATETQRLPDGHARQHTGSYCRRCASRIGD